MYIWSSTVLLYVYLLFNNLTKTRELFEYFHIDKNYEINCFNMMAYR